MSGKELPLGGSEEDDEIGGSATVTVFQNRKEKEVAKRRLQDQGLRKNKNNPSNKLLTDMCSWVINFMTLKPDFVVSCFKSRETNKI